MKGERDKEGHNEVNEVINPRADWHLILSGGSRNLNEDRVRLNNSDTRPLCDRNVFDPSFFEVAMQIV
jgi:hypothetical protein